MAKHTPGPWREFEDEDSHDIIGPDGNHIARMEPGHVADARLIAVTPELVALVRQAVDLPLPTDNHHSDVTEAFQEKARALLDHIDGKED